MYTYMLQYLPLNQQNGEKLYAGIIKCSTKNLGLYGMVAMNTSKTRMSRKFVYYFFINKMPTCTHARIYTCIYIVSERRQKFLNVIIHYRLLNV